MQSYDTFKKPITIGDTVVIGSHKLDTIITYSGEFYECEVTDIEIIENGPFGDILYIKKPMYGRNLTEEVILNKLGKFNHYDLSAVEKDFETIQIFSKGVIKIEK